MYRTKPPVAQSKRELSVNPLINKKVFSNRREDIFKYMFTLLHMHEIKTNDKTDLLSN